MSYEDFLNLSIGIKVTNVKGVIYKVAWKVNKDKWSLTHGDGVMRCFIHKNNYMEYNLVK